MDMDVSDNTCDLLCNVDSILFDLDGTLWNTLGICVKSLEEIKNKYDDIIKDISISDVISAMGLSLEECAKHYYGYLPFDKALKYVGEAFSLNASNMKKYSSLIVVYDNVKEVLEKLGRKYKLFIVSSCIDEYIKVFLDDLGYGKYFVDYECINKSLMSSSKKSENITRIIRKYDLKNPIYVGDTIHDYNSCVDANISFIYAKYGFGNVDNSTYDIDSFNDLCDLL